MLTELYAQSTVRRFRRWLDHKRIKVHTLYGPLIQQALSAWGEQTPYLALDTLMLWGHCCIIRIAVVYRGRAVLLVWKVLAHASSAVAFDAYKELLDQTAQLLLPFPCQVVFLADRGFADIELMNHLTQLGWQWRIRLKGNFLIYRGDHRRCKAQRITPAAGRAILWQWVQHGLSKGWALITRLHLPGTPDPEPVRASRKQFANKAIPVFQFIVADLASVVCS